MIVNCRQVDLALKTTRFNQVGDGKFCWKVLPLSLMSILSSQAYANPEVEAYFDTIEVVARDSIQAEKVNKTTKQAQDLAEQQVQGIRDVTRYAPGIAVVESGKGATSGYSIRGVDQNRVSIVVDNLEQAPSFKLDGYGKSRPTARGISGARHEMEYENVKTIVINQGSDSVAGGNGAMGGAVMMTTKDPADILLQGKEIGFIYKSGYTDKDKQWMHSWAAAMSASSGVEGLLQYTQRRGHEINSHKGINAHGVDETYDQYTPTQPGDYDFLHGYDVQRGVVRHVPAKEVTGKQRMLADPMDFESQSWLGKAGRYFGENDEHYSGAVFEHTDQQYNSRDMSLSLKAGDDVTSYTMKSKSHLRFFDESHGKSRIGLEYRYRPNDFSSSWFDQLDANIDQQTINIDVVDKDLRCGTFPNVDKSCRARYEGEKEEVFTNNYQETTNGLQIKAVKTLDTLDIEHQLSLSSGISRHKGKLDGEEKLTYISGQAIKTGPVPEGCLDTGEMTSNGSWYKCTDARVYSGHLPEITNKRSFILLADRTQWNQYVSTDIGIRHELNHMDSSMNNFKGGKYDNTAYSAAIQVQPLPYLTASYQWNTGYRVPSNGELYGSYEERSWQYKDFDKDNTQLKPETSINRELSLALDDGQGTGVGVSVFRSQYRDLIGLYTPNGNFSETYGNIYNAKVEGFTLNARSDLHALWHRMPQGLSASLSWGMTRKRSLSGLDPNQFKYARTYMLDTIQPMKVVYGLDYDAPSDKWGLGGRLTYSKAKDPNELALDRVSGYIQSFNGAGAAQVSKDWATVDVNAYYKPRKNLTLRAGINNLFDYRYVTWEALRQTVDTTANPAANPNDGEFRRFAAPGRNVALSMELRF